MSQKETVQVEKARLVKYLKGYLQSHSYGETEVDYYDFTEFAYALSCAMAESLDGITDEQLMPDSEELLSIFEVVPSYLQVRDSLWREHQKFRSKNK